MKITQSNFALISPCVQASCFHFTLDLGVLCLRAQWCFPAASGGSIRNIPSPCELKSQKCFGTSYWGFLNQTSYNFMTLNSWPIINIPIRKFFRWIVSGAEVTKSERIQTHKTSSSFSLYVVYPGSIKGIPEWFPGICLQWPYIPLFICSLNFSPVGLRWSPSSI